MIDLTFITGNQDKVDYLARHLGVPVKHLKVELEELQSLDLRAIASHKARRAHEYLQSPVLVEDVALTFHALGRLPGPFIKWFESELSYEKLCRLLDAYNDRSATAACVFGYYDGTQLELFESELHGSIADHPRGNNGFSWDPIFIPDGYTITRAEMGPEDDEKTYIAIKPYAALRKFIEQRHAL